MDRKQLIAIITKYHDYKRFIQTASLEEAKSKLSKLPRFGTKRVVLETEINFYGYVAKVDNLASQLTEANREALAAVLHINTHKRLSTAEIAKELGISDYKLSKSLQMIVDEINANQAMG